MLKRRVAAVLLPLLGVLCILGVASADETVDRIPLQPGPKRRHLERQRAIRD